MLSLIVDRVEPILCCLQSKTAQVRLLHKIGSTLSTIKDSTGALVA